MSGIKSLELKDFVTNAVINVFDTMLSMAAKVAIRVVASAKQGEELKSFQETSEIPLVNTLAEAQAAM